MAFTCGFFNSQNGDRKYNAEQMASIFDGLIKDGVYDTVGEIFAVTPGTGMQVLVGSGRAWFDHTWNNNDASYPLAITAADVSLPRYDAVVLETNHSDTVRTNRLRVVTGTPASNPVKPTMTSSANVKQHPLAYIKVTAGATAITQSMIQVVVGTSECPFVTGIIETAQIDALFQQWNGEFDEWFENLKAQLSDNVVANLQAQIDKKVAKADVATKADIEAGTSTTKWVTPKGLRESGIERGRVGDILVTRNPNQDKSWMYCNGHFESSNKFLQYRDTVGSDAILSAMQMYYPSPNGSNDLEQAQYVDVGDFKGGVYYCNNEIIYITYCRESNSNGYVGIFRMSTPDTSNIGNCTYQRVAKFYMSGTFARDYLNAFYLIYYQNKYHLYAAVMDTNKNTVGKLYVASANNLSDFKSTDQFSEVWTIPNTDNKSYNGKAFPNTIRSDGNYIYILCYASGGDGISLYRTTSSTFSDIVKTGYTGLGADGNYKISFGTTHHVITSIPSGNSRVFLINKVDGSITAIPESSFGNYQNSSEINEYIQNWCNSHNYTGFTINNKNYSGAFANKDTYGIGTTFAIRMTSPNGSTNDLRLRGIITFKESDASDAILHPIEIISDPTVVPLAGSADGFLMALSVRTNTANGDFTLIGNTLNILTNEVRSLSNNFSIENFHSSSAKDVTFISNFDTFVSTDDWLFKILRLKYANSTYYLCLIGICCISGTEKFALPTYTDEKGYVFIRGDLQ